MVSAVKIFWRYKKKGDYGIWNKQVKLLKRDDDAQHLDEFNFTQTGVAFTRKYKPRLAHG